MFNSNARRSFPVLVLLLVAALSLAPMSEASAAGFRARGGMELSARIEARLATVWTYLNRIWGEVGPRMDDNG